MVYLPFRDQVFVHDRKRWAADVFISTQGGAQRFDQRGFTRTHFAVKEEDLLVAGSFNNQAGGVIDSIESRNQTIHLLRYAYTAQVIKKVSFRDKINFQ